MAEHPKDPKVLGPVDPKVLGPADSEEQPPAPLPAEPRGASEPQPLLPRTVDNPWSDYARAAGSGAALGADAPIAGAMEAAHQWGKNLGNPDLAGQEPTPTEAFHAGWSAHQAETQRAIARRPGAGALNFAAGMPAMIASPLAAGAVQQVSQSHPTTATGAVARAVQGAATSKAAQLVGKGFAGLVSADAEQMALRAAEDRLRQAGINSSTLPASEILRMAGALKAAGIIKPFSSHQNVATAARDKINATQGQYQGIADANANLPIPSRAVAYGIRQAANELHPVSSPGAIKNINARARLAEQQGQLPPSPAVDLRPREPAPRGVPGMGQDQPQAPRQAISPPPPDLPVPQEIIPPAGRDTGVANRLLAAGEKHGGEKENLRLGSMGPQDVNPATGYPRLGDIKPRGVTQRPSPMTWPQPESPAVQEPGPGPEPAAAGAGAGDTAQAALDSFVHRAWSRSAVGPVTRLRDANKLRADAGRLMSPIDVPLPEADVNRAVHGAARGAIQDALNQHSPGQGNAWKALGQQENLYIQAEEGARKAAFSAGTIAQTPYRAGWHSVLGSGRAYGARATAREAVNNFNTNSPLKRILNNRLSPAVMPAIARSIIAVQQAGPGIAGGAEHYRQAMQNPLYNQATLNPEGDTE